MRRYNADHPRIHNLVDSPVYPGLPHKSRFLLLALDHRCNYIRPLGYHCAYPWIISREIIFNSSPHRQRKYKISNLQSHLSSYNIGVVMEKPAEIQSEHAVNNDTLQKVEASDIPEDLGGNVSDIPKGYWKSYRFIGSILGIYFMSTSLYLGYVLPVSENSLKRLHVLKRSNMRGRQAF
jgi:hypothetical protein